MSDKKSMAKVEELRSKMAAKWLRRICLDSDMLESIMSRQAEFSGKFITFGRLTLKEREKWTREHVLYMLDELSEVLGHVNFKHWKKCQEVDVTELKYEFIDLLCFLLNMMMLWGMDAQDVYTYHRAKVAENHRRQKEEPDYGGKKIDDKGWTGKGKEDRRRVCEKGRGKTCGKTGIKGKHSH
jgi:hypothetical protein